MFVTLSSAPEPGSRPASQRASKQASQPPLRPLLLLGGRREAGVSLRVYLRRYQASRAMMSSSSDRTSAMGRMWWLGDVSSSEEGGGVVVGRRQRSRKEGGGKGNNINKCIFSKKKMLGYIQNMTPNGAAESRLGHNNNNTSAYDLLWLQARFKTRFSSILSAEIGISSFCAVGKQWLKCGRLGQESESRSLPLALFIKAQTWAVN